MLKTINIVTRNSANFNRSKASRCFAQRINTDRISSNFNSNNYDAMLEDFETKISNGIFFNMANFANVNKGIKEVNRKLGYFDRNVFSAIVGQNFLRIRESRRIRDKVYLMRYLSGDLYDAFTDFDQFGSKGSGLEGGTKISETQPSRKRKQKANRKKDGLVQSEEKAEVSEDDGKDWILDLLSGKPIDVSIVDIQVVETSNERAQGVEVGYEAKSTGEKNNDEQKLEEGQEDELEDDFVTKRIWNQVLVKVEFEVPGKNKHIHMLMENDAADKKEDAWRFCYIEGINDSFWNPEKAQQKN